MFGIYDRTANKERLNIYPDGLVSVNALEIRGGSDFSENFDISDTPTSGEATQLKPGLLVSINPAQPGKLLLSARPYDRRVAGIISGAGDIKPGLVMSQEGSVADGRHPVALSGRVYAWVDATRGAIKPGDLLTTSPTPGHAPGFVGLDQANVRLPRNLAGKGEVSVLLMADNRAANAVTVNVR